MYDKVEHVGPILYCHDITAHIHTTTQHIKVIIPKFPSLVILTELTLEPINLKYILNTK